MARALVIGCGCRGRLIGRSLADRGWSVRGTSRSENGVDLIDQAGLEGVIADPAMPGSVFDYVADVTVVIHLLGGVPDSPGAEIHSTKLDALLHRLIDTPVRGFVYEPGTGTASVETAGATWRIPHAFIPPADRSWDRWADSAADLVIGTLSSG